LEHEIRAQRLNIFGLVIDVERIGPGIKGVSDRSSMNTPIWGSIPINETFSNSRCCDVLRLSK